MNIVYINNLNYVVKLHKAESNYTPCAQGIKPGPPTFHLVKSDSTYELCLSISSIQGSQDTHRRTHSHIFYSLEVR